MNGTKILFLGHLEKGLRDLSCTVISHELRFLKMSGPGAKNFDAFFESFSASRDL